ncbi:class I SAM-dependent methyltransferase [Actinomadura sp. NBRC 104412]|uniref:class I SAM-dependent methyltransferase n=1 Tax=Actinomadura sp. NBRC 104412 TaxID=3032203 RepID=UPI0025530F06|nr:class I SAM-dependent methyltransferase [Actinomadura sp. NBRC 104412]
MAESKHGGTPAGIASERWQEVLEALAGMIPSGAACRIDGDGGDTAMVADGLAAVLSAAGRPCLRVDGVDAHPGTAEGTVTVAAGRSRSSSEGSQVVIWLSGRHTGGTSRDDEELRAHVVVDLHDPDWPVIRHVALPLAGRSRWYVTESRAFFARRAATWDGKYGDDMPAYAAAIDESGIPPGGIALDVGCGTGRALPALRAAVGPSGQVIGVDLTPQMLHVAQRSGRAEDAVLLLADACHLPLVDGSVHAVFAAGLINHLPHLAGGIGELARVTRPGGRLIIFHPSGRAVQLARHGRTPRPDDPLERGPLSALLSRTGWRLDGYDDPPHRFLAQAVRT